MKEFVFRNRSICSNGNGLIMGILNVTPDSFYDGGEFFNSESAAEHINNMIADGADMIDIGAMSTKPGSHPVPVDEEIGRLAPVLTQALKIENVIVSVDTVNPQTADFALANGAHIINDVSGIFKAEMANVVKKYNAGWIMTHTSGVPSGNIVNYPNGVVASVNEFFDTFLQNVELFGIAKNHICLDPGFGFAKTTQDNIELLKNLECVIRPDVVFLTALSRKRFIGEITKTANPVDRLPGTLTADMIALMKGSDILRVHDVAETRQTIAIYNSIL